MVIPCTSQSPDNNVLGEYGSPLNRHIGVTDTREVVPGGSITSWGSQPMNGRPHRSRWKKLNALEFELMRGKIVTDTNTFASNVDGVRGR